MSSSNRSAAKSDGVLMRDQQPIGPMRLPENRAGDFVDQFNRIYGSLGLSIDSVTPSASEIAAENSADDKKKSPAPQ